ncbi:MAG: GntR family transcriptional regulator [Celeribacter sp.]|jgi:DNA-binding GntR family transcriptional regulator
MTGSSLARDAHARILSMIVDGELKPGDILQEAPLGARLDMSRTPVREALKRLESEGLARMQGRFTRLRTLPKAEVEEIFFLRQAVEPACAHAAASRIAAARTDPAEIIAMTNRLADLPRHGTEQPQGRTEWQLDTALHVLVAETAGNRATARVIADLHRRMSIFSHGLLPERLTASRTQHQQIFEAIAAGDPETAEAAMHRHLSDACDAILSRLDDLVPTRDADRPT